MEQWQKDNRRNVAITDLDALVPKDHLLRKIENALWTTSGFTPGCLLSIAINDTWGYEIWLEEYDFDGTAFTSTMYIDLYDHFGLDDRDVQKTSTSWGPFVSWFVLQRWKEFGKRYKPFVTRIPLRIPFNGIAAY